MASTDVAEGVRRGARYDISGSAGLGLEALFAADLEQRRRAAAAVEAVLPGIDLTSRWSTCGIDTLSVLRLDPGRLDLASVVAAIDDYLRTGDLAQDRGMVVNGANNRGWPIAEEIRTPLLGVSGPINVDPYAAVAQLREHNTLVLNEAQGRLGPQVADLNDDLSTAMRSAVQTNAYLSYGEAPGFGVHWDDHDVVIIQVAGRKFWEVEPPTELGPIKGFTPAGGTGEAVWSGVLEPGSVLAIPRGWAHSVQGIDDELSVHLTLSNRRATGLDLFGRVHPDAVGAAITRDDLESWYGAWYSELVVLPRNGPVEVLEAQAARYEGHEVRVSMLGGLVVAADRCTDELVVLRANRRNVTLARAQVPILAHVLGTGWTTVDAAAAAAGVDAGQACDLIDGLGAAGLVQLRRRP